MLQRLAICRYLAPTSEGVADEVPCKDRLAHGGRLHHLDIHVKAERRIQDLEEFMVANLPPIECPVRHHYDAERGIYAREMFIPAGVVITSRVHRDPHHCILSQGEILVFTVGDGTRRVSAPAEYLSPAGSRRAGLTVSDVLWTTYHDVGVELAAAQDLEAIEALIFEPLTSRQELLVTEQRRQLAAAPEVRLLREVA